MNNEPVAWMHKNLKYPISKHWSQEYNIPLYTHPVKDLEDIEINITWNETSMRDFGLEELMFAKAILRKASEK